MSHDPDAHSVGVRFRGAPLTECAAPHGLSCATTILANQEPRRDARLAQAPVPHVRNQEITHISRSGCAG